MRQLLALVATLAAALGTNLVARTADAQDIGSAEAGRTKAGVCAACHGPDGNSVNPEWPSLAGQHESYIVSQLIAYREGRRQNALMSPQAMVLSDEDMHDLAAWFSSQQLTPREADPELLNRGRQIYIGGDPDRGIAACIACHGPQGRGNPLAGYPAIGGQHATYAAAQLRLYASGEREGANVMMRNIAGNMTEDDINAVTSFIQGLR